MPAINCTKRTCFEGAFFVKGRFFNGFWAPARFQNELQNGPLDSKLELGWPGGGAREPPEPILVDFFNILKVILDSQMAILGLYWDGFGEVYLVIVANGSKQQ